MRISHYLNIWYVFEKVNFGIIFSSVEKLTKKCEVLQTDLETNIEDHKEELTTVSLKHAEESETLKSNLLLDKENELKKCKYILSLFASI